MVGIVVVSHSPRLARAAVDLALEMVPGGGPPVALAAGAVGGVTGTNAVAVAEAITEVASPDGVLVLMDLGSAVMSAEMGLEFCDLPGVEVRLSSAPFVEGLLAAVVTAAGGASLDVVDREARGALLAKRTRLDEDETTSRIDAGVPPSPASVRDLLIPNPEGVHARPAALLVAALAGLDAAVTVANLRTGGPPVAVSGTTALMALDARQGDRLRFGASGPDADEALARIGDLTERGFDEMAGSTAGGEAPTTAGATPTGAAASGGTTAAVPPTGGALGVSPGRGVGPVVHMPAPVVEPAPAAPLPDGERGPEADRVATAAAAVADELRARASRVEREARAILEANAAIATDRGVLDDASARVRDAGTGAALAVWQAFSDAAAQLEALGGRTAGRAADLHDVRNRIVAELEGRPAPGVPERADPFVLVARDLAPADTALLDPSVCRALVTEEGGPTSHAAILARGLGLPAVVAARGALAIPEGTLLLVDGATGELTVDPAPDVVAQVAETAPPPSFDGSGTLRDGTPVALMANVGAPRDARRAAAARAQGVGLFRTEFCFLDRAEPPGIDEQVDAYRAVLAEFPGQKVVIRTLDAGADKPLAFVGPSHEANPALGVRGLRTSRRHPQVLADQLEAIGRAAAAEDAATWVMAPMVDTVAEAASFAAAARGYGIAAVGVMVETPAAALLAEEILEVVDFVSLGTNDLAQYTMAADRLVGDLAALNDPWQPAVLRLVAQVGAAGARVGKPVGVCGEAAGDPLLAVVLVGSGVTSLSMAPGLLDAVAQSLAGVSPEQCRRAAEAARGAPDPVRARAAAREALGA